MLQPLALPVRRWRCRRLLSLWSLRCRCCLGLRLFRRSGRLFSLRRLRRGRRCWLLGLRRFRCRGRLGLRRFWRGSRLLRLWRFWRRRGFRCRRGRGLWQRVGAVCLGAQEGDHLGALIGVRQAWESHHGARREFGWLVDQPVDMCVVPCLLGMGLHRWRIVEAFHRCDLAPEHAVEIGADRARRALLERMACLADGGVPSPLAGSALATSAATSRLGSAAGFAASPAGAAASKR